MRTEAKTTTRLFWRRGRPIVLSALVATAGIVVLWFFLGRARALEFQEARVARAAIAAGRFDAARAPLARWLAAQPRSAEAHVVSAELALADGDLARVTRELNAARDLGCPRDALERVHVLVLVRLKRFAEAEPLIERQRALSNHPDPALDEALARFYLGTYRMPQAEVVLLRWAREAPGDGRPFLWLTEVDRRTSQEQRLESHYRSALERDAGLGKARLGLADLLREQHRLDEAAREYTACIERSPNDATAHAGLGILAVERNDLASAVRHLDRALELAPDDPPALKARALLDLRLGADPAAALPRLGLAIRANPLDNELLYSRMLTLKRLGRTREAEADSQALYQLRKDQAEVTALRDRLLGDPENNGIRCAIARWMFAHGLDEEGLRWTQNVLGSDPVHRETNRLLADYYDRKGEPGRANFHRLIAESGR